MLQYTKGGEGVHVYNKGPLVFMLQVCCSVLQCVAVYVSVLQYTNEIGDVNVYYRGSLILTLQVCCSVLQCVAVCLFYTYIVTVFLCSYIHLYI